MVWMQKVMKNFNEIVKQTDKIVKTLGTRWLKSAWQNEGEITQVLDILADDESRDNYGREIMWCFLNTFLKGQLAAQMSGMMSMEKWKAHVIAMHAANVHPEIVAPPAARGTLDYSKTTTFILEQYQYKDRVKVDPGDVCLDLGACLGDTSIWMIEKGAAHVHAFEIDQANRECMASTFAVNSAYARIKIIPAAVSDKDSMLYMARNDYNVGAGHIQSDRPQGPCLEIESLTLDNYCSQLSLKPDFIKMDIEGAELDAINGAAGIFERHRPKFAICIYHKWEHRWQIPIRLAELCPDYNFYVKKSHPVFETVFYGCPCEKLTDSNQE